MASIGLNEVTRTCARTLIDILPHGQRKDICTYVGHIYVQKGSVYTFYVLYTPRRGFRSAQNGTILNGWIMSSMIPHSGTYLMDDELGTVLNDEF